MDIDVQRGLELERAARALCAELRAAYRRRERAIVINLSSPSLLALATGQAAIRHSRLVDPICELRRLMDRFDSVRLVAGPDTDCPHRGQCGTVAA